MTTAVPLFAHGARSAIWAEPFKAIEAQLASARPDCVVRLAFLELMPPTLEEAAGELAALGCTCVQVVPLFLGAGAHVREDLPRLVHTLVQTHPGVDWRLSAPIGEWPAIVDAVARAILTHIDPCSRHTP